MSSFESATEHLLLRKPTDTDERHYRALLLDTAVGRWLRPAPLPALSDPEPGLWLARDIAHWRQHDFGPWVLFDRVTGGFVGRAGLGRTTIGGCETVEVAWALAPERWGAGLASEAGVQALERARQLSLTEVVAFTLPSNLASRRVMEKIGLLYDGDFERLGIAHVLYRLALSATASSPS